VAPSRDFRAIAFASLCGIEPCLRDDGVRQVAHRKRRRLAIRRRVRKVSRHIELDSRDDAMRNV
jgi:hypothetical protein